MYNYNKNNFEESKLEILYSQVKEERRFWFDKCLSYMNFYYTINITLFTAYFLSNYVNEIRQAVIILPILVIFICYYAKRINKICHNQFLENTVIMIKIEYLLGMYDDINFNKESPFYLDKFIGIERHFKNMSKFSYSEEYIKHELKEKQRTYYYNNKILNYMILVSVLLIIYTVAYTILVNINILEIFHKLSNMYFL